MIANDSDFSKRTQDALDNPGDFEPVVFHNQDGDCLEFVASPDSYRAERIDDRVTVFYSHDSGKMIGAQIKRFKELKREILDRFPGFALELHDGRVELHMLFRASIWSSGAKIPKLVYRNLIEVAKSTDATTEIQFA